MANLSWNEIQDRAVEFVSAWSDPAKISSERGDAQSFWSDFLSVYGIDRRRYGAFFEYAIKKGSGMQGFIDMFWPGKLLTEQKAPGRDLQKAQAQAWEYLATMPDHDLPQAIVVSDFLQFYVTNTFTREQAVFALQDFPKHVKLFGFLIEQQSKNIAEEDPVNIKAAEAMAKLHNQLRDDNYTGHDLELLLVRLVFCMFADDSGIFEHGQLRGYITNRTNADGSDLGGRLVDVFQTLNTPKNQRQHSLDEDLARLEYVNGGLFASAIRTPHFTATMRKDLLKAMELDWSKVSPAIFGSMFQGVMDAKERRNLGAHYTSEKNILRVIKPLFLDDLYAEFATIVHSSTKRADKLRAFQDKLAGLKFLDPACGSGNFLVITYRELRKLEHKVVQQINKANKKADVNTMDWLAASEHGQLKVNVDQMYGIEIEEFPSLIAQTALWLTDQQMNMEFSGLSGKTFKRLPLTKSATIANANALTMPWESIIAPSELGYILGNPPFYGSRNQTDEQKAHFANVFEGTKNYGVLDFVAAWYKQAQKYVRQNKAIKIAFVSTNSITQGEQVVVLWKPLIDDGMNINFAHRTFKWSNDAKGNAAVYCVVVGLSYCAEKPRLFDYPDIKGEPNEVVVNNINPYLLDAPTVFIEPSSKPLCRVNPMVKGNALIDDGNFIVSSSSERQDIIQHEPNLEKYIHPYIGSEELLNGGDRFV